jgi:uncharacterized damage-inducible protein DinB
MSKAEKVVTYFLSHREITKELVHKIEEKHYDYKPTETSMSAQTLVTHMLQSFYKFAVIAKTGDPSFLAKPLEDEETNLYELAEKYTNLTVETIKSMTDEEMDRKIDLTQIFGVTMNGRQLLHFAMDHEINHKGNLFVYVRLMGHTDLPLYVKK